MPKTIILLCTFIFVSCATTPAPRSDSNATATATIKAITPRSDTDVPSTAVIEADIEYAITNFDSRAEYYLAPLFESNEGPGRSFNEFQRITEGWKLTEPSGSVHIRYPIAREWRSSSLAKPVRVNFKIMVRTSAHSTKVIGETESVRYHPVV